MRGNRLLYGIAALALLVMLAVFIVSATDMLPTQTPRQQMPVVETGIPAATPAPTVKKKSCGCCAERRARLQKKIQAARERRRQQEETVTVEKSF